mmetsp:Transcript_7020/g.25881  ORF Transcript_7020/g.25881 Transcript_7020/m.25881 type:complete len:125 (-) Transcript_7020:863-1237(-)|eukprot:scaffold7235_cov583-Prasinococcus_capsulatus_cf.AAC.3
MDRWALRYGQQVAFVCVSCAGKDLAETFGKRLRLRHCHNTYVDDDHGPTWGQLGCSGFIVLDQRHSVVCKATSAFLDVRERAFQHVEVLVETLLADSAAVPVALPRLKEELGESLAATCATASS